jgi:uncharacterized protein involved in exopolysaccharide biosynthesis
MYTVTPRLILTWFFKDVWKILLISVFFATVSVFYALSIPNKYTSNAKVSSNLADSKSMGGALSNLGGLASLAGVSIGGDGLSAEVLKELLNSRQFIASFIRKEKIEAEILALKSYQPSDDSFVYDENIYDSKTRNWVRDVKFPLEIEPNGSELSEKFKQSFVVGYERKTKLITLSYKSLSPKFSQEILEKFVSHFNEFMRNNDITDSLDSVNYLKGELAKDNFSEVKLALQQILEEQYKKLALANTRKEYALKFIVSPMLATNKSEPKRAMICVAITIFGTFFSVLIMWTFRISKGK